jgi:hypothetical protein
MVSAAATTTGMGIAARLCGRKQWRRRAKHDRKQHELGNKTPHLPESTRMRQESGIREQPD